MAARSPWGPAPSSVPRVAPRTGPEVSAWLIHPDDRADYYETVFDFAALVEASRRGAPRLTVWTGRRDVDATGLRATLRRIVSAEVEAARQQLADGGVSEDEIQHRQGLGLVLSLAAQGTLIAMRATPAGLALSALLGASGLLLGRGGARPDPEAGPALEAEIARVQAATDAALDRMTLRLHPELAGEGGDPDAWPLPQAVRDVWEAAR